MDRSKPLEYQPLAADFIQRFVAFAKKNKTLTVDRDPEWADRMFVRGIDRLGRPLVGTWSTHPAQVVNGHYFVFFRDTAQDQTEDQSNAL